MRSATSRSRGPAQDMRFCLAFPRESPSIPFMRHVLGDALYRLGVDDDSVSDLLLAVTEACTNVLRHAGPGRRYEVVVRVTRDRCLLQVLDTGPGLGSGLTRYRGVRPRKGLRPQRLLPSARRARGESLLRRGARRWPAPPADIAALPESGRGLAIMRACVDDFSLRGGPGGGTVVSMRKRIEWRDQSVPAPLRMPRPEPALRSVI